jgi:hypothetical protein
MGVSYDSTRRVLMKHLRLHPYKITRVHELKERDIKVLNTADGVET